VKVIPPTILQGRVRVCPLEFIVQHPKNYQPYRFLRALKPKRSLGHNHRQITSMNDLNRFSVGAFPRLCPRAYLAAIGTDRAH
jgi:hypothetical protein